jgi:2-polyprenyl-3-methyl-5-hydroxy-6-metoxy-1,4-benzoquinol methylase
MPANAWNNRDGIELRRCSGCDFVFSAEADFSYEEFFATGFAGAGKNELMLQARAEGLDKMVAEIAAKAALPKGARVLDFGSGVGLAALGFMSAGFDVVVVEESRPYVEGHKPLGLRSFRSVAEARERCGSFDLVVMKDVLEHLSAPREVLSSVTQCVRPGGHFYIRVPNANAYPVVPRVDTRAHVNHFTPRTLVKLLAEQGIAMTDFVSVFDISSRAGKLHNSVFWPLRRFLPLYHQISLLCRRALAS